MSWSYGGLPASNTTDAVRYLAGQVSTGDDILTSDEEIAFALSEAGNNAYNAAALVCEALAGRYRSNPTQETVGQLSITWGDRAKAFTAQAASLRGRGLMRGVAPYVGGISVSDKLIDQLDTDNVVPGFRRSMDDNPKAAWADASGGTST